MPLNLLSFAENATTELDKAIVQKSVTGFFADNAMRAKFVGAKTITIPEMNMSGLGDYDRDNGFARGSVSVARQPYTLSMDRGRSFQIDREDEDEVGIPGLAGQVMGEFVKTKVVPEVDAYCLSKLASIADGRSQKVTGNYTNAPIKIFNDAVNSVQNAVGYDETVVAFLHPLFWAAIQSSTEISKQIIVSDFKRGDLNTKVKTINGTTLLPVPANRMKTAYVFYNGVDVDQEIGGFEPHDGASDIGLLVLPKKAVSLVKKTEKVRTFSPDQNQSADAWRFDYRIYYDLFIKNSMVNSVYYYPLTTA